jgi:hypothetical protein
MAETLRRGQLALATAALLILALHGTPALAQGCAGDCDGDGEVGIEELITLVNVALERADISVCRAGDVNADGAISIDEIIAGVNGALDNCAGAATPTPTGCTTASCRACASADTLCQPGQAGSYCCTLNGGFFGNPPATPPAGVNDPLDGCRFSGAYVNPTPNAGDNGCWSAAGDGTCYTQYVCLSGATPPPTSAATATSTATSGGPSATATATPSGPTPTPTATPTSGGSNLFQTIGIGADWGPHWSASTTSIDPRDNQDDAAFPPEICLVANAGMQSIRLYGENVQTWMAVVDGVQAYNQGALTCVADQSGPPATPLSVVYQAAICGPDPASLPWNGAVTPQSIDSVTCRPVPGQMEPPRFVESVQAEILKLKQVFQYAGPAFADTVKLVLVGNEILFSSGTCTNGGGTCSEDGDCASGSCAIAHYCSNTLGGTQAQAITCTQQSDCGAVDGPNGLCTDVTNGQALAYAFDQIQQVLATELGAASVPPISISLQVDVMTGTTPGLPAATAPVLWSRTQLANSLPAKIVAVNAYPDQWGLVPAGGAVPPYPSCIEASNGVDGSVLDSSICPGAASAYQSPVTKTLAHSIDTDVRLLTQYYPGFQVMFAETGWHTAGTCTEYNDHSVAPDRFSPAAAATYLQSLYAYATANQIPLLVFELFDQKTKTCTTPGDAVPAEANYGVFTNYCQLKQNLAPLLPSGANLAAFDALLSSDGNGGVSCEQQALFTVQGVGFTGVCAGSTATACLTDCGANGACVWGSCAENPSMGCNPDDPNNPMPCTCTRAGNCYAMAAPSGYYAATNPVSCANAAACSSASCPFGACGCYVAMAPATLPAGSIAEASGLQVTYGNGALSFAKAVGPLALVQPAANGTFIAQPLWDNVVVGATWTVSIGPPAGGVSGGTSPCANTVSSVTWGPGASVAWQNTWSCTYAPGSTPVGVLPAALSLPRSFLATIPSWPPSP